MKENEIYTMMRTIEKCMAPHWCLRWGCHWPFVLNLGSLNNLMGHGGNGRGKQNATIVLIHYFKQKIVVANIYILGPTGQPALQSNWTFFQMADRIPFVNL